MVNRIYSMTGVVVKVGYVLMIASLMGEISCKPALEHHHWNPLAPLQARQNEARPFYIECLTSSECYKDHCCVIGRQRFSIPKCAEHRGLGASCFPGSIAVARNLTYPDGTTVKFNGVYDLICPCSYGLHCDSETSQCVEDHYDHGENTLDPSWLPHFNSLYDKRK